MQSRNAYIGGYTEKWSKGILTDIAKELKVYAITKVVCEELSLPRASTADVAICKTDSIVQKPENIIGEVKNQNKLTKTDIEAILTEEVQV